MTKYETPRNSRGERICQFCQHEDAVLRESLGTKPVIYCSRNCRQRAYEARRTEAAIQAAVALQLRAALSGSAMSRDLSEQSHVTPPKARDIAEGGQLGLEIPAPVGEPEPAVEPVAAPLPVPKASRRRSAMTASPIPLPATDGVRQGMDPKGWLRAFDVYDERQASLFGDQGDGDVPAPRGE